MKSAKLLLAALMLAVLFGFVAGQEAQAKSLNDCPVYQQLKKHGLSDKDIKKIANQLKKLRF